MLNYSSAFRDNHNKCHLVKTRSTVHSLYELYLITMLIQPSSSQRNHHSTAITSSISGVVHSSNSAIFFYLLISCKKLSQLTVFHLTIAYIKYGYKSDLVKPKT